MHFRDETSLDQHLSQPTPQVAGALAAIKGPLLVLGAGGKMGPTLAVMARRAAQDAGHALRVIAVSRFQNPAARAWLESQGVETLSADLFDDAQVQTLPDAGAILYLVGLKFGTATDPSATWAANTLIPATVGRRFPNTPVVALSTGNVYPFSPVESSGASEEHELTPCGEYANAAVARERIFQWIAARHQIPLVMVRLSYAVELRYGVLHDIARRIWADEPVPVDNARFNCIWQRDANEAILRLFPHVASPPLTINLTGEHALCVRTVASGLADRLERPVRFVGQESESALLSDVTRMRLMLGVPATPVDAMMDAVADWIRGGGRSLGKPTGFQVRSGRY